LNAFTPLISGPNRIRSLKSALAFTGMR
jgi:hypothetical protein